MCCKTSRAASHTPVVVYRVDTIVFAALMGIIAALLK